MGSSSHFVELHRPAAAVGDLVCFHHAGGASRAYREWHRHLQRPLAITGVELPGRGRRFGEPIPDSLHVLADDIAEKFTEIDLVDGACIIFGHSLGGVLGFEVAKRLEESGGEVDLDRLVVSGTAPTQAPPEPPRHQLSDSELLAELEGMGGTPSEVLEQDELMELYLPVIRQDFRLVETYEFEEEDHLETSITALGGESDPNLEGENLTDWEEFTTREFQSHWFPGGHFYLESSERQVVTWLESHLVETGLLSESPPPG